MKVTTWKIIIGGLMICAGIAQIMRLFSQYQYENSPAVSIGLGILFTGLLIAGIYVLKQGKEGR